MTLDSFRWPQDDRSLLYRMVKTLSLGRTMTDKMTNLHRWWPDVRMTGTRQLTERLTYHQRVQTYGHTYTVVHHYWATYGPWPTYKGQTKKILASPGSTPFNRRRTASNFTNTDTYAVIENVPVTKTNDWRIVPVTNETTKCRHKECIGWHLNW